MYKFYVEFENGSEFELTHLSLADAKKMHNIVQRNCGINPVRRVGWEEM